MTFWFWVFESTTGCISCVYLDEMEYSIIQKYNRDTTVEYRDSLADFNIEAIDIDEIYR